MSDYLKSALGYLNGGTSTNEYVGQTIEINNVKLRVTKLLAEGGWALVFAVEDINTGKEYALKRLIAVDEDANRLVIQEIETLKRLSGHPNIIQFLYAERLDRQDGKGYEYLLVTELCPGGTVADILRGLSSTNSLTLGQICTVAYQATRAVHHMHSQQPEPIVHRDIKLENFLVGSDGLIKLCDFGSVTTQQILPDPSWNAQKRSTLEDQMAKFTTPMYRPPEIMDTWSNEPIGPPIDCWALGCILYTLISLRHPFPEGNKLAIVNGKYPPLPASPRLACLNEIVKGCLDVAPMRRFTTAIILERLAAIAESNDIDLREPAKIEFTPPVKPPAPPRPNPPPPPPPPPPTQTPVPTPTPPPPRRPPPIGTSNVSGPAPGQASMPKPPPPQATGLFSSIRGGAGSILRNIKDTSSKVMHSVQQSMARTELDASYLTSRILIMPYPADGIESAYRANHVEDVRAFLQARHPPPARLQLYNLSRGRANVYRLPGRHIDCSFAYASSDSNTPLLSALYQICQDIYRYLSADFSHVVVLYCTDGCRASATIACTLLLYAGVVFTPQDAITLFTSRRCQPIQLQPSELRSINYMSMLRSGHRPHVKPLALCSLVLQPVPLFTRAKDACRPYIEIYSNGALVFSTKRPEYEEMRLFGMMEGKIALNLGNVVVRGDVTIVMFHARQQLGRVIGIKIASLHFHTGYASLTENTMTFEKKDLDDVPEIGGKFRVILHTTVAEENGKLARLPAPWEADTSPKPPPDALFGSTLEMEETLENFRTSRCSETKDSIEERVAPPAPATTPVPAMSNISPDNETIEEAPTLEHAKLLEESAREENILQEADLLNLGMPETSVEPNSTQAATKPGLDIFSGTSQHEDDLLGGFGNFAQSDPKATPIPTMGNSAPRDLLFGHEQVPTSTNEPHPNLVPNNLLFGQNIAQTNRTRPAGSNGSHEFLFDPLGGDVTSSLSGGLQNPKHGATLKSPNVEEGFPRNASLPNFAAQNKDPFASLASTLGAGSGLTSSWNGTPRSSNTPQSASPAPASTPVHSSPGMQRSAVINEPTISEPAQQSASASASATLTSSSSSFNVNKSAKPKGDMFDDLLGSQGYNFFSSKKAEKDSPRTINEMRKVEAARTMDPDRSKVAEWTEGKKSNLRALLCSLHTVLWSDAEKWQKCEMHQLVTAADVKKAYRRACLTVHPDKQRGTANENLSKLIFMELNNAWSSFENDASQQNLFN